MKYYNLDYYVDKLKKGEHFSLARYGDGEFLCMWGKKGGNSNGCRYSPELRQALLDSLEHKDDPTFIYGMQRVLPQDKARAEHEYDVDWHDSEFLSEAVANGELFPFIEQLKKMKVVVIGNSSIFGFISSNFDCEYINVPASNAYDVRESVTKAILEAKAKNGLKQLVFLFSCGMAANAFISERHGKDGNFYIDVGHIWDPFVGNMSRCDLEGKTMEDINKNLYAKT